MDNVHSGVSNSMPKKLYQINDFSGGLNTLKDPADISDNECSTVQNMMFNIQGSLQPAYSMTNSSTNKVADYNNATITTVQPGYGLGYFETDHNRDPVVVTKTTSIAGTYTIADGNISGGTARTGFAVYQHNTNNKYREIEYLVSNSSQDLATSFPVGTLLKIEGDNIAGNGISVDGLGFYYVVQHNGNNIVVDRDIKMTLDSTTANFWGGTLTGTTVGDKLLLLANPADHKIDVYSTNSAGTKWTNDAITLSSSASSIASKVKYYKVEDEIRCCDTSENNDCKIQWYGWVQRRHFQGCNRTTDSNSYTSFYARDNDLAKPTVGHVSSSTGTAGTLAKYTLQSSDTYQALTAGQGFNVNIATETDQEGVISKGIYELAQTFIYDNNQESLPKLYSNTHTVAEANDLKSLSINISTAGPYDPRISGGRIYIREQGKNEEWVMLLDINLTKGCRLKFSDDYSAWDNAFYAPTATTGNNSDYITNVTDLSKIVAGMSISGGNIQAGTTVSQHNNVDTLLLSQATSGTGASGVALSIQGSFYSCPDYNQSDNNFRLREFGLLTYEILNGFSSNIFSHTIGDQGEYWKDSVISNNRVFICNVSLKDENTGLSKEESTTVNYPDRIMYSMPNRYDTFPSVNYIEAAKGDADSYIALESYADRLLAFKSKSLDIINISGDDRNWFLEDSKKYQGVAHPEAVKKTQYGIVWVNKQGLFIYDGSSIRNLTEAKIKDSDWSSHVGEFTGIIYDEQESMVFIINSLDNNGDAYMCDLKVGNFTYIKDFVLDTYDGLTNSVDTDSNNTFIAHDSNSAIDIYQLNRTPAANTQTKFSTKMFDFGNIHHVKKIYAIYVTYKSSADITDTFTLVEEDGNSHDLGVTIPAETNNWTKIKLTPQTPVVCNKVSLVFFTNTTSSKVYINDISFEYRVLSKRGT